MMYLFRNDGLVRSLLADPDGRRIAERLWNNSSSGSVQAYAMDAWLEECDSSFSSTRASMFPLHAKLIYVIGR